MSVLTSCANHVISEIYDARSANRALYCFVIHGSEYPVAANSRFGIWFGGLPPAVRQHRRGFYLEGSLNDNVVTFPKKSKAEADEEKRLEEIGAAMESALDGAEEVYESGQMVSLGIVALYADEQGRLTTKSWMIPGFAPGDFCLALWTAHYSLAKELIFNDTDDGTKH